MSLTKAAILALAVCAAAAAPGCSDFREEMREKRELEAAKDKIVIPPQIAGTVAERAGLKGGGDMALQGYGVVVGLGKSGSREVPPHIEKYIKTELTRHGIGSYRAGTEAVTPDRLLRDMDTAVVLIGGAIPPGAPEGSTFDVYVSAMPNTQTESLVGGVLWATQMYLAWRGSAMPGGPSFAWAEAGGDIFVNPFLDPSRPADAAKLRRGRIIGGGKVLKARPIELQLYKPSYSLADLIQRRVNERFGGDQDVANARNAGSVLLNIPPRHRDDFEHFLDLVLHLPLTAGGAARETHARRIATEIQLPGADGDSLALVWEAIGRQVLPIIQPLYKSENDMAAFYSARTGMRLGDRNAVLVLTRFARRTNSMLQIEAIRELGRHADELRSVPVLRELLNADNEMVRVEAYESLAKLGDSKSIQRKRISGGFTLDLVDSNREYALYATQTGEQKIVLFGKDMTVRRNLFYSSPDDMVTVNSLSGQDYVVAYRKVPRAGRISEPFKIDFKVSSLIKTLGSRARPVDVERNIEGLGLSYGQLVGVLYQMCKANDIPAKFVLQQPPEVRKMYREAASVGRPDMPEE